MDKALTSVTLGQCDARPTVTYPTAGHHRLLAGTKIYFLVTGVHIREQLAEGRDSNQRPVESRVQRCNYYATRPHRMLTNLRLLTPLIMVGGVAQW